MFDSPRPATGMTATPNATAARRSARTLALALLTTATATLIPALSHAAVHRGPVSKSHAAAPARHAAAVPVKARGHRELQQAAAAAAARPAKGRKGSHAAEAVAETRSAVTDTRSAGRHGRDAIEAARRMVTSSRTAHAAAHPIPLETANVRSPRKADDAAADSSTADRVHAWYKSRGAATDDSAVETASAAPKPVKAKPVKAAVEPDLSPTPHKATVEDFQRAAQQQRQTLQAAVVERQSRTTDDDDAAEATTRIPSTAPTAREALPFVHGDLLATAAGDLNSAPRQATLPVAKLDRHLEKHPDTKPDAQVLAKTPDALDTASAGRTRIIAAETASVDVPKLSLPKPVALKHDNAPAVAALKAAAKKRDLDPQTAQAITDDAFDPDSDPVSTAKAAPAMAARTAAPSPAPIVRQVANDSDDNDAETVKTAAVNVDLYDGSGRLKMLPPMKGTHEILVHQNQMAVADGLDRIEDDGQMAEMRRYKLLVSLPDNDSIWVNDAMPANRRYARPWTVRFLNDLSKAHYTRFHTPLVITSAVRTVEFQRHLVRINGNAAPPTGDIASPHLYGQAVDLGKRGMSVTEVAWMRAYLTPVESAGKIDVEEEFQQSCFHISVYRRYLGLPAKKNAPAPDALPQRKMELVKASPAPSKRRRRFGALLAAGVR